MGWSGHPAWGRGSDQAGRLTGLAAPISEVCPAAATWSRSNEGRPPASLASLLRLGSFARDTLHFISTTYRMLPVSELCVQTDPFLDYSSTGESC